MKNLKKIRCTFVSGATFICLLGVMSVANATVIDNFQSGGFDIISGLGQDQTQTQSGLSASSVIGGSRTVRVAQNGGNGTLEASVSPSASGDPLSMTWSTPNSASIVSGFVRFTYGVSAPLGADLTAGGADRFTLDMGSAISGFSNNLEIAVTTAIGTSSSLFETMNAPGQYQFLYSDFSNGGVDFNNVNSIELTIGNVYFSGLDTRTASASLFQTASAAQKIGAASIPEPPTIALMCFSVMLLGLVRLRRS